MNYGYKKAPFIGAENKENYKQYLTKAFAPEKTSSCVAFGISS